MNSGRRRCIRLGSSILLVSVVVRLYAHDSAAWKDPSPHIIRFVNVEEGVRIEVLDWGGSGSPLVLLAGGGDTAHIFDDFAPKLTADHHVYGLTRRGFGASGFSPVGYGADRLGDDVLAVIDALTLNRPVLVGHSLAGEELSSVGTRYPDRVAGLIYLDAAYPYAFDNGKGPTFKQFLELKAPQPPEPNTADLASFHALQMYYERVNGFRFPVGELRWRWESSPDGRVTKQRNYPGYATLLDGMKQYASIPVRALIIFANPHDLGTWVDQNNDPAVRKVADANSRASGTLVQAQIAAVTAGVPTAKVITLAGAHHYVFLSNQADVLREMHAFIAGLH